MKNISTMKNTSFRLSTSVQRLRRVAIFAAVLVMSMANVGVMWGNYAYMDLSGFTDWYNGSAWFRLDKNGSGNVDSKTEIPGTGVWRFDIGDYTGDVTYKRMQPDTQDQWNYANGSISSSQNVMRISDWNVGSMQTSFVINYIHGTNQVYFDNSVSNFPNNIYFVIGHDYSPTGSSSTYTIAYKMSPVTGTKLFHVEVTGTWQDANFYAIIADDAASISATDWGSSDIGSTDKGDKGYTAAYKTVYNMEGGSYLITTAAAGNGKDMTITYYSGYGALPQANATQAAKKRDAGTSYSDVTGSWPATLKLKGSYMKNATDTARSTITSTASTDDAVYRTYGAIKTGTITQSYTSISSDYYFEGWGTGDTPSNTDATNEYQITTATTVYAFFSKKYTLTFLPKGTYGTSTVTASVTDYVSVSSGDKAPTGHSITVTATPATGYKLVDSQAWFSDAACSKSLGNGTNTTFTISSLNKDSGVYAKFEPITYSITYNLNSGTQQVSPAPATSYNITSSTITLPTPTRDNYTFAGWYDNSGFTGSAITTIASGSYGNKEYWAKWTETPYTVSTSVSGGGGTATSSVTDAKVVTASSNITATPTNVAWRFKNWVLDDANVSFADGYDANDAVIKVNATANSSVTAHFQPRYGLHGSLNEGGDPAGGMPGWAGDGADFTVEDFDAVGEGDGKGVDLECARTLEPNKEYKFRIQDREAGGRWGYSSASHVLPAEGDGHNIKLSTYGDVSGKDVLFYTVGYGTYTFKITNMYDNGDGKYYPAIEIVRQASSQLTLGVNNASGGSVSAVTNEGSGYTITNGQFFANGSNITFTASANTGYTFAGWYSDSSCETAYDGEDENVSISSNVMTLSGLNENTTVYAKFTPNTYTADNNLDKNSGDSHGKYTATFDATSIAINTTPAKTGYHVDGYYGESGLTNRVADSDGALKASVTVSEVVYTDSNGKWKKDGNVTLYAKWTADSYTITLDNQSAKTAGTESISVTYDANTNLTGTPAITKPTRSGYTFGGYYTATGGSGTQIIDANGDVNASASDASYTYTDASKNWKYAGDITLYAKWTGITYSITYKECDNSTVITGLEPTTYVCGVGVAELPTPTKSGYTFDAWYSKYCVFDDTSAPGGHGFGWVEGCSKTSIGTTTYGDYVFLAKWHQTVTLNMQGVCSNLTPTVEYLGTELLDYSTGTTTFRDGTLLGYYTAASDGTKVLNANGTFAASSVTDYITEGKWTKTGATTLYAQYDATISLPDTLDISNYVAYGGGVTIKGDSLDFNSGDGSACFAEWKVNLAEKCVYTITTNGYYNNGHHWQLSLVNSAGTVDSTCTFTRMGTKESYTETKNWYLSGIESTGEYIIRMKNIYSWGTPKLLYVAVDPIKVTYDGNGGTPATESAYYTGSAMTLPSATRSGYVFEGWYSGGTKIGNAGESYEPTASITLTAKWGIITALPDTLTKENVGDYSSDMEWTGDDDEYFDYGSEDKANLGRWAKWEVDVVPCEYNISAVVDYTYPGSNAIKWGLILFDGADTVAVYNSERIDGQKEITYDAKWDLTKDKSGEDLTAGTYTLEVKNIQSYARPKLKSLVLSPDLYTITYDAGEYGSGSIAAGQKIGCNNFTLSSSTFTRAGYTQDGWATSDGGDKAYNLGGSYTTDAAVTLYPHWTCATPPDPTGFATGSITDGGVTFTITDDADAASYDIYYSTSSTAPTGSTDATTTSTSKSKEVTGLTAATTYYAWVRAVCDGSHKSAWVALDETSFFTNYTITMGTVTTNQPEGSTVGGTISASPSSAAAGDEVTLTATPTSGYTFIAWQIVDGSSVDKTEDLLGADSTLTNPTFTMPAYSVTVKATFARQYTITYKEDDKTTLIDGLDPTTYIYGVGVPELPTPERTGYTFDAWYKWSCVDGGSGFADGCKRTAIDNDAYGDYTFYGKFIANTYTITLNNQSATSAGTESISVTYNDDENLTDEPAITSPTKTCYSFGGYYTETAGGGTQIIDADGNVNASVDGYTDESKNWIHAGNVTLYAKWTQVNLAKSKTAYSGWSRTDASTGQNDGEVPSKAVDGSLDSHHIQWAIGDVAGNFETRGWWAVNLGDNYVLSDIKIYWQQAGRNPYSYEIQAAITEPTDFSNDVAMSDDTNWRTIKTISGVTQNTGSTPNVISFTIGEYVTAHYLRLVNKDADRKPMAISEFEVFGYGDEECYAANTPTASFAEIVDGQIKLNLSATNTNGDALTNFAVLYDGVYYDVTASEGVGYLTLPTHRDITVRVYAYNKCMQRSSGYVDVEVGDYVNPDDNLALNKDAYACKHYSDSEGEDKANDGSTSTYWTSYDYAPTNNEWWYVDLGDFYNVNRIEVVWMNEYASANYSIQYRQKAPKNDSGATSSEWDAISEFTNVPTGDKSADLASSVGARYLCMRSTAHGSTHTEQNRLAEIRVFGSSYGTPDDTPPTWTDANCAVTSAENHTITMTLEATDENPEHIYDFFINVDNGTSNKDYERSTTEESNEITIDDDSFIEDSKTYTITVKCYDHVGNEATKVFSDVTTEVAAGTNLALGKDATAGTTEGGGDGAYLAVDGNTGTEWSGNSSEKEAGVNQWIEVDLGKNYDIDSIKIMWGWNDAAWPQDYEIQVSYNGTDYWSIVHNTSKDDNQANKYLDLGVKGRYVRVWAERYGISYGMCMKELEVYGQRYTEDNIYDFTGQVGSSTAWATAANWTKGAVPSATDTVRLLAPVEIPADNTIQVAKVIVATGGKIGSGNSLSVSGKLTVAAGGALVVTDSIKRCADAADFSTLVKTRPSDIVVKSSAEKGNGTLLFTNTGDSATVEMYCKASTASIPWTWQYVGVPFTTADPQKVYWGGYMYYWPTDASGWESVTKSTTLSAFTGYSLSYTEAGHVFSMEGQLAATTSKDIAVPAGKDMVVGNSWTAPIQIKQLRDADFTNLLKNVYFYNVGNDSTGAAGAASSRYEAGTYVTVPIHSSPYTGDSVISALQGFFVTSSGSAGSLHLSYADHVRPVGGTSVINGQMHAPKRAEEQPVVLKIWANGSEYTDRVVLLEREDFSEGFDDGWDGDKWINPECTKSPLIYAVRTDGTKDAVSALPELDGTIIGFRAGEDNTYTLRFEYAEDNDELYIVDTQTTPMQTTRVLSGNTYTFNTSSNDTPARFLLTRSNAPQITTGNANANANAEKATKLILDQQLYIYRNGILYDATGRRVDNFSVGSGFDANANANANAEQEKGGAE